MLLRPGSKLKRRASKPSQYSYVRNRHIVSTNRICMSETDITLISETDITIMSEIDIWVMSKNDILEIHNLEIHNLEIQ